jgi:hypothetical protein
MKRQDREEEEAEELLHNTCPAWHSDGTLTFDIQLSIEIL